MDSRLSVAVLVSLLFALPAAAQNAPSQKQRELNRDAYSAMKNAQIDVAVRLYGESLAIAPLNVTFLNLGRAHQKAGHCDQAWSAFDRVSAAPAVDKPAPDKIAAAHRKFTDELVASCPTRIEVRCANEGAEVSIAGDLRACPAVFDLTPGTHEVRMTWSVVQLQKTVSLGPGRAVLVEFAREPDPPVAEEPKPEPDVRPAPVAERASADFAREPDPPVAEEPKPESDVRPALVSERPPAAVVGLRANKGPDWGALALLGTAVLIGAASAALDGAIPLWPAYAHDRRVTEADFIPVVGYTLAVSALVIAIVDLADGAER